MIGAKQFLYRLGIKTIINVIGVEPELFQCSHYDELKETMMRRSKVQFLVLNEDIVPEPREWYIKKLKTTYPCCKIMYIGYTHIEDCGCTHLAINIENQKEMVEQFQSFFFEPEKSETNSQSHVLSEREIDVLQAVAHGMANKEIADKLSISTNTVITHRKNITDKLGIKTIAGLTVYAVLNNLINPEEVKQ